MITISQSKKAITNTIASISNLINNILRDYNANINANDVLAKLLDLRVSLLDMGISIDRITRTYLINKAMDTTKSDPYAEPGKHDPLMQVGNFIIRKSLLPTKHKGLESTIWKLFQAELAGSRRRHAHERDTHLRDIDKSLLSLHAFISPSVLFPEQGETKQKTGIRKKLTFKKAKEQTTEEKGE